jgi:hypothetical protein
MREIQLSQGKTTILDDEDYIRVSKYKWHYAEYMPGKGYAKTKNKGEGPALLRMHRFILGLSGNEKVDHINGDGLDNRKDNLRIVNQSQNMMNTGVRSTNTSGFKGVCYDKRWSNWLAHVWKDGKQIYIGSFKEKEDAARAYNEAAKKYHGEYARLNEV